MKVFLSEKTISSAVYPIGFPSDDTTPVSYTHLGFRIFGSSPETHCRIEGRHAYIDPIAGTTKRTGDAEQDALNARYL